MTVIFEEHSQNALTLASAATITPFPNFTDEGLSRVRRMFEQLAPSRDSMATLFALDAAQTAPTDSWTGFFVHTLSDYLIWDVRPTGLLTEDDACWVLARFDEAPSLSVIALLVRILDEAQRVPAWFPAAVRHRSSLFRSAALPGGLPATRKVAYLRLVA